MTRHPLFILVLPFFLIAYIGCDNSFNPKGPYEEKLIAYSILSTKSDTQYVAVLTTYNPEGDSPYGYTTDTQVTDAHVTISQGATIVQFRDTVLERKDKSRYQTPIVAYVVYPFKAEQGKTYTLEVQSPSRDNLISTMTVPHHTTLDGQVNSILKSPWSFEEDDLISLFTALSPVTRGFLVKFFLYYEVLFSEGWKEQKIEIPLALKSSNNLREYEGIYPQLVRRMTNAGAGSTQQGAKDYASFNNGVYRTMLSLIFKGYGRGTVRVKRAVFELTQVDENLYTYYNLVNGFRDQYSTRVDQPDYTNIRGGIGVFGSFAVDSVTYLLPETLQPPGLNNLPEK